MPTCNKKLTCVTHTYIRIVLKLYVSWYTTEMSDLNTKFVQACDNGDISRARELLAQGAQINAVIADYDNYIDYNALTIAVKRGRYDVIEFLAQAGANLDVGTEKLTPLMDALIYGDVHAAELLIKLGANPQITTPEGNILHSAACSDSAATVRFALKYCQDTHARDEFGHTPLAQTTPWCADYATIKQLLSSS